MKKFNYILIKPKGFYENIKTTSFRWGEGLIILITLVIISNILSLPISKAVMNHSDVLSKIPSDKLEMVKAMQEKMKYIGVFTSAIFFVIKLFFYSSILWLLCFLGKNKVKFIEMFSLIIIAYFVVVLGDIANIVIIYFQGIDKVVSEYSIFKTGLNVFFNLNIVGPILYKTLIYFNPFQIWFVILIITGLNTLVEMKISKAILITLIFWLITIIIPVFMTYLSEVAKSNIVTY